MLSSWWIYHAFVLYLASYSIGVDIMLSIKNLHKTYANGVHASNDISLEIPTGLFGLLGPNGAGKSSLMRTIATLQDPDSGSIHFNGLDVLKEKEALRRQLGYLPQDFGVYPKVSALDLLNHFAILKGLTKSAERKEMVESLLHMTNLWEARKRGVGSYSGGMRQRFGIAQALLGAPKLVIVDEPTAGLDPDERNRFLNLLAKIGEEVVVILSTHIVADVTDLCPRMAMIGKGKVLVSGEPKTAIETMRKLVWRRSVSEAELTVFQDRFTVLSTRLVGGKPVINIFSDMQPDDGFVQVEPDLEDVYFLQLRSMQSRAAA
jgi:ABC-2 type transport system ATP-binding protein